MRLKDVDNIDNLLYLEQKRLESNDDRTWERNRKYYRGIAFARRILEDAPTVESNKWHDLRKDPNDLPSGDWDEEIILNVKYFSCTRKYIGRYIRGRFTSFNGVGFSGKVIAWREIEPFEVEE